VSLESRKGIEKMEGPCQRTLRAVGGPLNLDPSEYGHSSTPAWVLMTHVFHDERGEQRGLGDADMNGG
jgi:hypothetical protein